MLAGAPHCRRPRRPFDTLALATAVVDGQPFTLIAAPTPVADLSEAICLHIVLVVVCRAVPSPEVRPAEAVIDDSTTRCDESASVTGERPSVSALAVPSTAGGTAAGTDPPATGQPFESTVPAAPPAPSSQAVALSSPGDRGARTVRPLRRSSARTTVKKHVILFLAANPSATDRLALDLEARAIHQELKRSGFRDRFDFQTRWAAEPLDLLRELRELKPTIVHFSGHGGARGGEAGRLPHHRDLGGGDAASGRTRTG